MQGRITGNDGAVEFPFIRLVHELGALGIFQDVMANADERIAAALAFLQHMIVGLMLKFPGCQPGFEMGAQKGHAILLVRIRA